jgi:hypothetical protein
MPRRWIRPAMCALVGALWLAFTAPASAGGCSGVSFSVSVGGGFYGGYGYGYRSHCRPSYRRCYGRVVGYGYRYPYRYSRCGPRYSYCAPYVSTRYVCGPSRVQTYTRSGWRPPVRSVETYRTWQVATAAAQRNTETVHAPTRQPVSQPIRTVVVTPSPKLDASGGSMYATATNDVWAEGRQALADGHYATARTIYGNLATRLPGRAGPKIGYGVSSALLGDEQTALWSLRRALLTEPEAVGPPQISDSTRPLLETLSEDLRAQEEGAEKADRWMLIATVDYLRGEIEGSREALAKAEDLGEEHLSANNLRSLVGLSDAPLERVTLAGR